MKFLHKVLSFETGTTQEHSLVSFMVYVAFRGLIVRRSSTFYEFYSTAFSILKQMIIMYSRRSKSNVSSRENLPLGGQHVPLNTQPFKTILEN